jgi:hypothetical protein
MLVACASYVPKRHPNLTIPMFIFFLNGLGYGEQEPLSVEA